MYSEEGELSAPFLMIPLISAASESCRQRARGVSGASEGKHQQPGARHPMGTSAQSSAQTHSTCHSSRILPLPARQGHAGFPRGWCNGPGQPIHERGTMPGSPRGAAPRSAAPTRPALPDPRVETVAVPRMGASPLRRSWVPRGRTHQGQQAVPAEGAVGEVPGAQGFGLLLGLVQHALALGVFLLQVL